MNKESMKQGFLLALGEVVYVAVAASIMSNGERLFVDKPEAWSAATFLVLLVVSVSVSGALILGKPILLYLDGKKQEAVRLFGAILLWLVIFLGLSIFFLAR
jgi:hypothetical protein